MPTNAFLYVQLRIRTDGHAMGQSLFQFWLLFIYLAALYELNIELFYLKLFDTFLGKT